MDQSEKKIRELKTKRIKHYSQNDWSDRNAKPSGSDQRPPDFKVVLWNLLSHCFKGRFRIVVFIILVLTFGSWWNWDKLRQLPLVKEAVNWGSQQPLPKADPNRFAIALMHIENDHEHEIERLIAEALKEFEGVQTVQLDRLIPLEGIYPEKMEKNGYKRANEYLRKTGAQVLIWGTVIRGSGQAIPKLYWTTSINVRETKVYNRYRPTDDLKLPVIFWEDLSSILCLLIGTQNAEFQAIQGQYVGAQLRPFVEKVRQLLKGSEGKPGWNEEVRAQTRRILADSLLLLGDQTGDNEALQEAVAAYRAALGEYTRQRTPLDWALIQTNLGNTLRVLGERENGTRRLEEAVAVCREALKELSHKRTPLGWAHTQNNLGNSLQALGGRESGTRHLEEAVAAFQEALTEYTHGIYSRTYTFRLGCDPE